MKLIEILSQPVAVVCVGYSEPAKAYLTAGTIAAINQQIGQEIDGLDIEKELNSYSEEEATGWFHYLERLRQKLL